MAARHITRTGVIALSVFVSLFTLPAWAQLTASVYVSGLSSPVGFYQDPTNAAVQFVLEQGGRIRVISNGALQPTDFLNLTTFISSGGERGLLGLAFAPDYATSRRFFVNFTDPAGNTVVARFLRSAANPLQADLGTRFDLQWPGDQRFITQPFANHNGGNIAFGPDGYLYIGMGDGGSGNDPDNNAQNPNSLLGKMLRINVNVPLTDTKGYTIPPDNPFLDGVPIPALGEIWSFGLRNPWKWNFDDPARGGTGALVIGDVGQSAKEEIDYEPAGRGGRNYGWRNREGDQDNVTSIPPAYLPLTEPIIALGRTNAGSITGGFVYRGARLGASFRGRYLFGDFVQSRVYSVALTIGPSGEATASDFREHTAELGGSSAFGGISAFGVDANGELYVLCYGLGRILKIDAVQPPTSDTRMALDTPANGSNLFPAFVVSGWALDFMAATGNGVDIVHVYAYPQPSGSPIFLGAATPSFPRPDVAALFGSQFANPGFRLQTPTVPAGRYLLVAYAHSTVANAFNAALTANIAVGLGARMAIDAPAPGTYAQPVSLVGWAIDLAAASGPGVDSIHVYAYPPAGAPIFLGLAQYGATRADVASFFGASFGQSGFTLTIRGLAPGTYLLVVYAHSAVTGAFDVRTAPITIVSSEHMAMDAPSPGAAVRIPFVVAGWAFDGAAPSGTGVDRIDVWAYPTSGAPIFLGTATYGGARPDVAAFYGAQFQNSAYGLTATGLSPGTYIIAAFAHSTVTRSFSNVLARAVVVQ